MAANDNEPSALVSISSALGMATVAAACASVPPSIRAGGFAVWIAMLGIAVLPIALCGFLFARAWQTVRAIRSDATFGISLWAVCFSASAAAIGAVLRQKTHHHALAGVTFAVLVVALALGWALIIRRVLIVRDRWLEDGERGRALVLTLFAIAIACALALRAARGVADLTPAHGGSIIDGLALLLATGLVAQRMDKPLRPPLAFAGLPLSAIAVFGAIYLSRTAAGATIAQHAPLYAILLFR